MGGYMPNNYGFSTPSPSLQTPQLGTYADTPLPSNAMGDKSLSSLLPLFMAGGGLLGAAGYASDTTGFGSSPANQALMKLMTQMGGMDPNSLMSALGAIMSGRLSEDETAMSSRLANQGITASGVAEAGREKQRGATDLSYLKIEPELFQQSLDLLRTRIMAASQLPQSGATGDVLGGAQTGANILSALATAGLL